MGTQRIARVTGTGVAKELILLAENFGAARAKEHGLLHRIVPDESLETDAHALAMKFLELPPRAVGIAKRILDQGWGLSMRESQELEIDAQSELLESPDFREAIESFFEKRPPRYQGK